MSDRRLDASALRDWAHNAVGDLITHTDEINRLTSSRSPMPTPAQTCCSPCVRRGRRPTR